MKEPIDGAELSRLMIVSIHIQQLSWMKATSSSCYISVDVVSIHIQLLSWMKGRIRDM
jgi:hypothetical protein